MDSIRNPIEWATDFLKGAGARADAAAHSVAGEASDLKPLPIVNHITFADIRDALRSGFEDFLAFRTDVLTLSIVYPAIGLLLWWVAANNQFVPLLFPIASGFALVGPIAAVGLYEMSRQREQGKTANWAAAFDVVRSPSASSMIALGLVLLGIFVLWLAVAQLVYSAYLGPEPPESISSFANEVFLSTSGRMMAVVGCAIGLLFAIVVLAVSVVSFPMLLDRNVGLAGAMVTSVRAVVENPKPMALWGLIVASGLLAGSLPFLLGLVIVVPVLGHATWHLYRKLVARP